jgi:hypothetical protein
MNRGWRFQGTLIVAGVVTLAGLGCGTRNPGTTTTEITPATGATRVTSSVTTAPPGTSSTAVAPASTTTVSREEHHPYELTPRSGPEGGLLTAAGSGCTDGTTRSFSAWLQFQTPEDGIYIGGTDAGLAAPAGAWRAVFRLPTGLGAEVEIQPACYATGTTPLRPLFRYDPRTYRVTTLASTQ